jgi:hypothetical protein
MLQNFNAFALTHAPEVVWKFVGTIISGVTHVIKQGIDNGWRAWHIYWTDYEKSVISYTNEKREELKYVRLLNFFQNFSIDNPASRDCIVFHINEYQEALKLKRQSVNEWLNHFTRNSWPKPDVVLTRTELEEILAATNGYRTGIKSVAKENNVQVSIRDID